MSGCCWRSGAILVPALLFVIAASVGSSEAPRLSRQLLQTVEDGEGAAAEAYSGALHWRKSDNRGYAECWNGPGIDWGGMAPGTTRQMGKDTPSFLPSGPEHVIVIAGHGCKSCVVGKLCNFVLHFASDLYFDRKSPDMIEFEGTLEGPTIVAVDSVPDFTSEFYNRMHGLTYHMSYIVWRPGLYNFTLESGCVIGAERKVGPHTLANFFIEVSSRSSALALDGSPSPCEQGHYGTWVAIPKDPWDHRWQWRPFSCMPSFTRETYVRQLLEKGIREISFIGDSHQRVLFCHFQMLIAGVLAEPCNKEQDFVWSHVNEETGMTFVVNYYWLDGIYHDGEYDCMKRGPITNKKRKSKWYKLPVYSATSDIVILESASWTFQFCSHPEVVYAKYLPEFLDWMAKLPRKPSSQLLWRSSPPVAMRFWGCEHRRMKEMRWTNNLARNFASAYGMKYLDLWQVEAPLYEETCWKQVVDNFWMKDAHYSCPYAEHKKMTGLVGEAVTTTLMHLLLEL